MAHAARAAQKEHRHRRHRGHHGGIVPGAADQAVRGMAGRRRRPRRATRSASDRPGRPRWCSSWTTRNATPRRSASSSPARGSRATAAVADLVARVADVDAQPRAPWNHVDRAGLDGQRADRRPQARDRPGEPLDLQHELGRRRQRVEPAFHRQGPGVTRPAPELDPDSALARDRLDHSDGSPQRLEHRPLLDVGLQVAEQLAGADTQPRRSATGSSPNARNARPW